MDEEFLGFAGSYEGDQSGLLVGAPVTGGKKSQKRGLLSHSQVSSLPRGQQGASAERPAPASVPHSAPEILESISLRKEGSALFILLLPSKSPVDPACKDTCSVAFQEAPQFPGQHREVQEPLPTS